MIKVRNLTKKYGNHLAVNDISFDIKRGRIYGLLGPNGAGKSTTMNIITGCLAATSGSVLIGGHDIFEEPIEAKKHIGYLPEQPPLYVDMTPREYLLFVAEAKGVSYEKSLRHVKEIMKLTQIEDVANRLIRNLSKGYRQRVGIAQAMIGDPEVIILDEPTVGLDPNQIIEIRNLITNLGRIKTVIISSHILAEISAVCDHVIIISHGKVVADDTLEHLEETAKLSNGLSISVRGELEVVRAIISSISGVEAFDCKLDGDMVSAMIIPREGIDIRDAVFSALLNAGLPIVEKLYRENALESVFLALTGGDGEVSQKTRDLRRRLDEYEYDDDDEDDDRDGSKQDIEGKDKDEEDEDDEDDYKPLFGSSDDDDEEDE